MGDSLAFEGRGKRGWKVEEKVAAATREQQLMVGILEHQSCLDVAVDSSRLRLDQPSEHSEEGALPTAVAPHKHPQSRSWNAEAAAVQSAGSAGPAKTHVFELKNPLVGGRSHGDQLSSEKPGRLLPPEAAVFS